MSLKQLNILQGIVAHHGDCNNMSSPSPCHDCPLGQKIVNGQHLSCVGYLGITTYSSEEDVNALIKDAAEEELFNLQLQVALQEDDDSRSS